MSGIETRMNLSNDSRLPVRQNNWKYSSNAQSAAISSCKSRSAVSESHTCKSWIILLDRLESMSGAHGPPWGDIQGRRAPHLNIIVDSHQQDSDFHLRIRCNDAGGLGTVGHLLNTSLAGISSILRDRNYGLALFSSPASSGI